jgi:hypothetical protein
VSLHPTLAPAPLSPHPSQVWKSVVPNTGRALREILATLIALVVSFLASDSPDSVGLASRCLGDIVKKLGERVLPEIVPTLREVRHATPRLNVTLHGMHTCAAPSTCDGGVGRFATYARVRRVGLSGMHGLWLIYTRPSIGKIPKLSSQLRASV